MLPVGVGLIGSQFISTIHARSLSHCDQAKMLAVVSPTPGHAQKFANTFNIPHACANIEQMLAMPEIDMVVIGAPNHVHCELTIAAAEAGKHVLLEKPMCLNLREADQMIAACEKAGKTVEEMGEPATAALNMDRPPAVRNAFVESELQNCSASPLNPSPKRMTFCACLSGSRIFSWVAVSRLLWA